MCIRDRYALLETYTPFDLQAYLAMICNVYFYGRKLHSLPRPPPSTKFPWDFRCEAAVRPEHLQQKQWPAEWRPAWTGASSKPLVQQLVGFAVAT